jgi:hypothetical protein
MIILDKLKNFFYILKSFFIKIFIRKNLAKYTSFFWDYCPDPSDKNMYKPLYEHTHSGQYEINVSKNGMHVFATDRNVRHYTESHTRDLVLLFKEKFPESDGYRIDVSCYKRRVELPLGSSVITALKSK